MFQRRVSPQKGWDQKGSPRKQNRGRLNQQKQTADRVNQSKSSMQMQDITAQPWGHFVVKKDKRKGNSHMKLYPKRINLLQNHTSAPYDKA